MAEISRPETTITPEQGPVVPPWWAFAIDLAMLGKAGALALCDMPFAALSALVVWAVITTALVTCAIKDAQANRRSAELAERILAQAAGTSYRN